MQNYIYSLIIALGAFFTPNSKNSSPSISTDNRCSTNFLSQEEEICMNAQEQMLYEQLKSKFNRASMEGQILYIPVRAHYFTCEYPVTDLVNYSNCATYNFGNPSSEDIENEINYANEIFNTAGFNVQLYLNGINAHINNNYSRYYDSGDDVHIENTYAVSGEINLYYFYKNNDSVTQHSNFPWYTQRGIYLNRDIENYGGRGWSVAHEAAHWFGLYHTYETAGGAENVTRDYNDFLCYNCNTAGDLVCDTQPAKNFEFLDSSIVSVNYDCSDNNCPCTATYVQTYVDGCGQPYTINDADLYNLMNYGYRKCTQYLTAGQVDRMWSYIPQILMNDINLFKLPASYFCPASLTLFSEYVTKGQRVESSGQIDSYQKISTTQNTLYDSGTRIILQPGFAAMKGTSMNILIDGCEGQKQ